MLRSPLFSLLLASLAAGGVCADQAEADALRMIERLGGRIRQDKNAEGEPGVAVDLRSTPTSDADLKRLAGLTNLRELLLNDTRVADAGLKHLGALLRLRRLYLAGTGVTDAGLKELPPWNSCRS
jgi:hypothetical protein